MTVLRRLLWLFPLLASPVGAQEVSGRPETVTAAPALKNGPAWTLCAEGRPLSVFEGPLAPDVLEQLAVHEAEHRRQLAGGDCDLRLAAILGDSLLHAEAEAEAGCVQFDAVVVDQIHRTFELGNLRTWLYGRFPSVPRDTLNAMIARRCGLWKVS